MPGSSSTSSSERCCRSTARSLWSICAHSWTRPACSRGRRSIRTNRRYTEQIDGNEEIHNETGTNGEKIVDGRIASVEEGGEEVALESGGGQLRRWRGDNRRRRGTRRRDARHRRVAGEGEDDR